VCLGMHLLMDCLGLLISNTPGAVDDATADVAMYLMLGAFRRSWIPELAIREGRWKGKTGILPSQSMTPELLLTKHPQLSATTRKTNSSASSVWVE